MWKWTRRAVFVLLLVGGGYIAYAWYEWYMAGYDTRPAMPDGAFSMSYKNGLRAILIDVPNEQEKRRYFGLPFDVPFYLKDVWSFCSPPGQDERDQVGSFLNERDWPGERLEAICKINVDGDVVIRGLITSVPRL